MTKKKHIVCDRCGGKVTSPRRGIPLDVSFKNHQAQCPAPQPKEK